MLTAADRKKTFLHPDTESWKQNSRVALSQVPSHQVQEPSVSRYGDADRRVRGTHCSNHVSSVIREGFMKRGSKMTLK